MNESLRSHVTRTGFSLELGKLHLYHLVKIDLRLWLRDGGLPWYDSQAVKGHRGLYERGLIEQKTIRPRKKPGRFYNEDWTIFLTPAGQAVVTLLRESGLYAEYAALIQRESA